MDPADINKFDGLFWRALALSLPDEGVAYCFPDEPSRLERLIDVRWPQGPTCNKCGSEGVSRIKSRQLFQCEQ
ncbi:transposase [Pacificibacter marinus]|uniref:transposase n=1 Tax=Pacificibacter marinus TaxID=658057 RepID=UPI001C07750B|nr:transposase [Pacificibacter marinus]